MKTEAKPLVTAENTLWPLRINPCENSAHVQVPHGSDGESWELSIHCPSGGARRLVHLIETIGRFSSATSPQQMPLKQEPEKQKPPQQEPPSLEQPSAADRAIADLPTQIDSAEDDDPVWSIRVSASHRFDERVQAFGWPPPAALLDRWERQLQELDNQLAARGWPLDGLGGNDLWIDLQGRLAIPVLAARIAQSMWARGETVHRQLLEGWQPVISRESQRAIADLIGGLRQVRQQIATDVPATAARIDSAIAPPLGPLPSERAPQVPTPQTPAHLVPAEARTRFGRTRRRPNAVRRSRLLVLAAAAAGLLLAQSGWWLGGSPVAGGKTDGEQPGNEKSPQSLSEGPAATAAPRTVASLAPPNAVAPRSEKTLDEADPPLEGQALETLPRESPLADVPTVDLLVEMPIPTLDPLGSGEASLDLQREGFEPFEPQAAAAAVAVDGEDGEDGEDAVQARGEQAALEEPDPAAIDSPQQIEPIQLRLVDERFSRSWPIPSGADLRRAIATLESLDEPLADFSITWLAPIRAARGRNHRGILELARGDEADVRIRLRFDLRLGREAELEVVAAATLDRGFTWHRVHTAAIPAMIDSWTATRGALESQRRAVENTLDQLPQSPLRTALRGKEKSLLELDRQATAILERIGQLQQLLAEIETQLVLRLTILRSTDPSDPPLLNTLDVPVPHSHPVAGDEENKEQPMASERRGS